MDIEDESDTNDTFQRVQMPNVDPMFQKAPVMFNRPPPNFAPNALQSAPNDFVDSNDTNDRGEYFKQKRGNLYSKPQTKPLFSLCTGSDQMSQDRDREFRGRLENRRDFNTERGGRNNSRWSEGGRSRENDRQSSRDRNDRHSPSDRMRGGDSNNRDFSSRNSGQWSAQSNQLNFNNSNMNAPPALEDIRIPIESLRGMPMLNNKSHHSGGGGGSSVGGVAGGIGGGAGGGAGRRNEYDRRSVGGQQGRDFFNQNRFGPPVNGPPMNMIRGKMAFAPKYPSPVFMSWQQRAGM